MSELFDGKVAVVTGAGRGLGRSVALELARRGARVVVNDFFVGDDGVPVAEVVANEIREAGGHGLAGVGSIDSFAAAQSVIDLAVSEYGRLDFLVTCAGNFAPTGILDLEEPEWESVTGVHLTGHLACLRAAAAQMIAQGDGGRIVTVSSRGGLFGTQVAYSGAKAAILGLTSAAALELGEYRITVNCLLPSARTQLFTSDASARRFGGMPESMHMEPDFVAPLVAYLCTPAASDVTGRYLYASGGDICVYAHPLTMEGTTTFVRRTEGWTVETISDHLPALLGVTTTVGA